MLVQWTSKIYPPSQIKAPFWYICRLSPPPPPPPQYIYTIGLSALEINLDMLKNSKTINNYMYSSENPI